MDSSTLASAEPVSRNSDRTAPRRLEDDDVVPRDRSDDRGAPCVLPVHCVAPERVTPFFENHIRQSGYYEQLRHIVEPSPEEVSSPGAWDTSGERHHTILTGLQHKYRQTALILAPDACYAHCRFCFRKRFVGITDEEVAVDYARIAAYIAEHSEITNVLISGGDPMTLPTKRLREIVDPLLPIPHVKSIRIGTKALVYHPPRFRDDSFLHMMASVQEAGKTALMIVHVDHFAEISPEMEQHVGTLRAVGVQLLSQSVLLHRVNDDVETLVRTFRRLHCLGIRPYYLFQARPVRQASHFQVPLRRGMELVRGTNRLLGGIEKTFRFIMSHHTGKIEILDLGEDGRLYMRYHQCPDVDRLGRVFSRPYREGACWLDDLAEEAALRSA